MQPLPGVFASASKRSPDLAVVAEVHRRPMAPGGSRPAGEHIVGEEVHTD